MRLLHWYPNFLAGGAISETVLGLANAQMQLGHEVLVVSRAYNRAPAYNPHLRDDLEADLHAWNPTLTATFGKLSASLVPLRSLRLIRDYQADILHIHNGIMLEDALIRYLTPQTRAVLTPHGALYPQASKGKMRVYVRLLKPLLFNHIAAFHALSPNEVTSIRRLCPNSEIYVVPSGLSSVFERLAQPGFDRREEQQLAIRLVCVGRLDIASKGIDILLHAFARAATRLPQPLELVLVGPHWRNDSPKILDMIHRLGISDRVTLAGAKDRDGVAESLRASDIFIQMSRWDAFSLGAIEAMALGLPCILSSRIGAASYPNVARLSQIHITEPLVEKVCVTIQEVVRSLSEQRETARRLVPDIVTFFSWKRAAAEHERAYRSLLAA
jgi:glycosyltransferase involved in cell wall biosynthesis